MATTIIRYSNSYAFEIDPNGVDLTTDEVIIHDYAKADPSMIYCVLDKQNEYSHRHEMVSRSIVKGDYNKFMMHCYTPTFYYIPSAEKAKLLTEGVCTAFEAYGRAGKAHIYVGLKIEKFLDEEGKISLAKCYEKIAKSRKQYAEQQAEIATLLAMSTTPHQNEDISEKIIEDIKWFLDNRNAIKAKFK